MPTAKYQRSGRENRSAAEIPAEILHADLEEMKKKLEQYGEDLRGLAEQMSSREFRN